MIGDKGSGTGPGLEAGTEPEMSPLFNQSLEKGLGVLRAFNAERRTMTLPEIAEAVGITKSSAQRMVYTLEKLGYITRQPQTRRYQLALGVMQVGYNYLAVDRVIDAANPFLSELTNITGETCNLTEPDGTSMVYVARFSSPKFIPIHMPIGSRIPMYCSASGRAYLSALPPEEVAAILARTQMDPHTPHTVTSSDKVQELLAQARQRGYASNREELFLGDCAIAAPVLNNQRKAVAAVHLVVPTSRWSLEEAEQRLASMVIECARSVSNSIRNLL